LVLFERPTSRSITTNAQMCLSTFVRQYFSASQPPLSPAILARLPPCNMSAIVLGSPDRLVDVWSVQVRGMGCMAC
jgi:hypothetical protein